MSVRVQYRRECDRCAHPFEDAIYATPEDVPERSGDRLVMHLNGEQLFDWRDLCASCTKTVHGLLDRLRLTSPPKKKPDLLTEPAPAPSAQPLQEYLASVSPDALASGTKEPEQPEEPANQTVNQETSS